MNLTDFEAITDSLMKFQQMVRIPLSSSRESMISFIR